MGEDFADLGAAAAAGNPAHEAGEARAVGDPAGRATFVEAAVVNELHLEPADRRRLAEHLALELAGGIPGRLAAHGGVKREDQPPALAGFEGRRQGTGAGDEGVDLRARGGSGRLTGPRCRSRSAVAILCHDPCRAARIMAKDRDSTPAPAPGAGKPAAASARPEIDAFIARARTLAPTLEAGQRGRLISA